jgi:1-acyl-sn-glycerol-3-phosphate acyltransferase
LLPLPSKVTIRFGEPLVFEGDSGESEDLIREKVQVVKDRLQAEIHEGLAKRGDAIFSGAAK